MNMFSEKLSAEAHRRESDEIQHLEAVIDWLETNAADRRGSEFLESF